MVQHTPWAVDGGSGCFSCVGADVLIGPRAAVGRPYGKRIFFRGASPPGGIPQRGPRPPFGRFKGRGFQRREGRFPLSGGNVERSETKGVGPIRNPPFPKRLFGDFLSAQKVTRPQAKHPLNATEVSPLRRRPTLPTAAKYPKRRWGKWLFGKTCGLRLGLSGAISPRPLFYGSVEGVPRQLRPARKPLKGCLTVIAAALLS